MKKTTHRPKSKIIRPKTDYFVENKLVPYFAEVSVLQKFITERGKIYPRSRSGLSAKNQRRMATEIKYARHLALLPFLVRE